MAALVFLPSAVIAQVANEFWPEIDISYRPAEHQRTLLELKGQADRETSKNEAKIGLYQDYLWLPHGFVRAGYRYIFSTNDARHRESRLDAEGTLNRPLGSGFTFTDRLRWEFRWVNKEYSFRIRERLRLEREQRGQHTLKLMPYTSLELFYDSRFYTIARLEGRLGSKIGVRGPLSFDVFYVRQQNSRTSPHDINALGLGLAFAF
ncbi:MAG TPA: DUF2490 domain-containing protein [Gemmatimonadaceae bacterium]